ncbi:MAG: hypothetical protein M3R72_10590 [Bacteroidota bacterium]|nr:hypothetical protein [Bacteroidota bacterium]
MNISMTWASYALVVSTGLFIYYAVIAFVYRKTYGHFIKKRTNFPSVDSLEVSSGKDVPGQQSHLNLFGEGAPEAELKLAGEADHFTAEAQDFADEIEACTSSCGDAVSKEELFDNLRKIIQKYPSLIHSGSQYELSQLIAMYSENNCSLHFSADDLQALWN